MFKTRLEFRSFDIRICLEFRYSNFGFKTELKKILTFSKCPTRNRRIKWHLSVTSI
jgi:hypothetical protein